MSDTTTAEFQVSGASCSHCEQAIRAEVSKLPGVTDVDVSAATGRLAVTAGQRLDDDAVLAAVDAAGYAAQRS